MNESNSNDGSLQKSSSFSSSREGKEKKVAFKTSYPSADLEQNLPDRDTEPTDLKDFSVEIFHDTRIKPDLSFYCKQCETFANLAEYKEHKEYHDALNFLELKSLPKTDEELRQVRKSLIDSTLNKYFKKQKDLETNKACEWSFKISQINTAYEKIMSYVDNSFEANKHISDDKLKFNIHAETNLSLNESILAIGFCSEQNKYHRQKMEDTFLILDKFGELDNLTYVSVFDGYDGEVASNKCIQQLHLGILFKLCQLNPNIEFQSDKYVYDEINHLNKYSTTDETTDQIKKDDSNLTKEELENRKIHQSFIYSYHQMDKLLTRGKDETSKVRWSGATATTCIIEHKNETNEGWIHIANCGDVEAMVVLRDETNNKQKNYKVLTRLHTLNACAKDRERIERNNGKIVDQSGVKRLEGLYNITRAFGFHGDKNVKKFISSTPSTKSYKIESDYVCLIIATKGLWNTLTYKSVSDIVIEALQIKPLLNVPPTSPSVYELLNKNRTKDDESLRSSTNNNHILDESFDLRKKTGNLFGAYRNNLRNMSSTPTEFNINGFNDDSEEVFYTLPRPKSTPHDMVKLEITHKKFKKKKNQQNELNENKKNYSNSDIYPLRKTHALMNQKHDLKLDINDIKDVTLADLNLQIESKKYEREPLETKFVDLKFKSIQVNDYEIRKFTRDVMENREDAKRLELTEHVVEKLIISALLAGSTDNITISCILLPGYK